jgi:hypothetical protein
VAEYAATAGHTGPKKTVFVFVIREFVIVGLVLAGVAHVPCLSGSGVCVCVYLYKLAWFGQKTDNSKGIISAYYDQ